MILYILYSYFIILRSPSKVVAYPRPRGMGTPGWESLFYLALFSYLEHLSLLVHIEMQPEHVRRLSDLSSIRDPPKQRHLKIWKIIFFNKILLLFYHLTNTIKVSEVLYYFAIFWRNRKVKTINIHTQTVIELCRFFFLKFLFLTFLRILLTCCLALLK